MVRVNFRCICAFMLLVLISYTAPLSAKDLMLTKDSVSRFIETLPEMKAIAMREGLKAGLTVNGSANKLNGIMNAIKSVNAKNDADTITSQHGFKGIKDWLDTGKAIANAYLYISVGENRAAAKSAVDKNKESAAKEIEKLGFLSQKAKDKLKDNIAKASEELGKEPPKENVAVVKEFKSAIDEAVQLKGK